jgi:DNA modification methylase
VRGLLGKLGSGRVLSIGWKADTGRSHAVYHRTGQRVIRYQQRDREAHRARERQGAAEHPMQVQVFKTGVAIHGEWPDQEVAAAISTRAGGGYRFPLAICDPPYGKIAKSEWEEKLPQTLLVEKMLGWLTELDEFIEPGGAVYWWGGIGKPGYRPFFEFASQLEQSTRFQISNYITWGKKRGYGVQTNYLFTREECLYLVKGDYKKPHKFAVPYLETKRGYAGYNKKYPAKSEYLRRTNVWTDITEILRGKVHEAQKPEALAKVMIEVHTKAGEWVLDPFAGSGSTALACLELGRRFAVVERGKEEFEMMCARIRGRAG